MTKNKDELFTLTLTMQELSDLYYSIEEKIDDIENNIDDASISEYDAHLIYLNIKNGKIKDVDLKIEYTGTIFESMENL